MNPAGATMCGACYAPIVYSAPGGGYSAPAGGQMGAPMQGGPTGPMPGGQGQMPPVYQYQPPQYQGGYSDPVMAPRTSGMAIAGFVLSFFCSLLGLIFSIIGYNECKNSNGAVTGGGLALAGIIISIVGMVFGLMWVLAVGSMA